MKEKICYIKFLMFFMCYFASIMLVVLCIVQTAQTPIKELMKFHIWASKVLLLVFATLAWIGSKFARDE